MGLFWYAFVVLVTAIVVGNLQKIFHPDPPLRDMQGWCAPGWRGVADAFRESLHSGLEKGGAFAAYYKGEKVVDVYGGYRDFELEAYWKKDTLGLFFSATKFTVALAVAVLVDRGHLNYEDPITKYWPEFGQNGKDKITVKHLMSHSAGLWDTDNDFSLEEFNDSEKMSKILEQQKPSFEPGTKVGYNSYTYSIYVDQLVRRVDPKKRSLKSFLEEEIFKPFGIEFHIGLPMEEYYRTSRYHFSSQPLRLDTIKFSPIFKLINYKWNFAPTYKHPSFLLPAAKKWNRPEIQQLPLASGLGFATATNFAKLMGIVANGGISHDGKTLLKERTLNLLQKPVISGRDVVYGVNMTFGLGIQPLPNQTGSYMIGSTGHGGQMAFADLETQLGFAYVTNYLNPAAGGGKDRRFVAVKKAMYVCVDKLRKKSQ